jgi:predicted transcriptional regulator
MKKTKDVEIKARVTRKMRARVEALADARGETLSLIIREAVAEYLAKRRLRK